jgi:hypothetical protein
MPSDYQALAVIQAHRNAGGERYRAIEGTVQLQADQVAGIVHVNDGSNRASRGPVHDLDPRRTFHEVQRRDDLVLRD